MKCLKCDSDIPEREGAGRPRKFCGPACRKSATKEIRRLDARIARFEVIESETRIVGRASHAERIRAEIAGLESRMLALLDAGGSDDEKNADV